jgi:hypothetical protein
MNFLHSKLQECTKSELDLFSIPQTQTSLEKGQWIDSQPVSSVSASNPITLLSAGTRRLCGLVKNNVGVRRSKSKEDDADYKLNLIEAYLQISKIKVSPSISVGHELVLKSLRRMQRYIIPAGNPSLRKDNIFSGLVLKLFLFGLVASNAYNGSYKKNPYNFQNFSMLFVGITVNGKKIPFKPMQLSYATGRYIEA